VRVRQLAPTSYDVGYILSPATRADLIDELMTKDTRSSTGEMQYVVIVEEGANSFGVYVPDLPGCAVVGETREEALQLIRGAVELHVSSIREQGDPLPEPASTTEYVQV
jgi:predicted RNase H-like HicB family nuclease